MDSDAPPPHPFLFTKKLNSTPNMQITTQNDAVLNSPNEHDEIDVDDPHLPPQTKLPIDDSRKLFQRLFSDEDEIELLQGFLDYNTHRISTNHHHHDTTAFYDQIKTKFQLNFNRNQLVEKLRRLKKKYRNVVQKIGTGKEYVFKSNHDQATFEISKKIWGGIDGNTPRIISQSPDGGGFNDEDEDPSPNANLNFGPGLIDFRSKKRSRVIGNAPLSIGAGDQNVAAVETRNVIEETIRSCLSPVFKELLNGVVNLSNGAGGLPTMPFGLGFGVIGNGGVDLEAAGDEKWRKQHILELEVFSKRLELVQDQIKVKLEELKAKGT